MLSSEVIGIDLGKVKTGIARASLSAKLAEPLLSVPTDKLVEKLRQLQRDNQVDTFVVGLPRNLSGDETGQTQWVRQWVQAAKQQLPGATFYFQDEALTSRLAITHNQQSKKTVDEDALAAAAILQDFVDSRQRQAA